MKRKNLEERIIERATFSSGLGKVGKVYTTLGGKKLANPEEDLEGWMQIDKTTRRKVVPICLSGHNPMYGWEFHQF